MGYKKYFDFLSFILGAVLCGAVILLIVFFGGFGKNSDDIKEKEVRELIHKNYVGDVTDEVLTDGKYRGMLDSLGDKYASYFNVEEFEQLEQTTHSTEKGIGIYVYMDESGNAVISGTIPGTPAESSGLKENDIIVSVNGETTEGKDLDIITAMIKESENTAVLEIDREGELLRFEVEMGEIPVDTVGYGMTEEGNIGYIYISKFGSNTDTEFKEAYDAIMAEDPAGLIIDLRENLGGLVESCTRTLSQFVPEGLLVYTENKAGKITEFRSDCTDPIDIPLVVLVNGRTASASEIFAGAVKDRKVGTIVGEQTYGKGIVQSIIELRDGSAIRITTSSYYTPDGISLNGEGLKPDVEVVNEEGSTEDRQFNKAVEIIKEAEK